MWTRLDDDLLHHDKTDEAARRFGRKRGLVTALGTVAFGLLYANWKLTDGFLHDDVLDRYGIDAELRAVMVAVRFWERDEARGGYRVHDFFELNPSAQAVKAKRAKDRARKQSRAGFRVEGETEDRTEGHRERHMEADEESVDIRDGFPREATSRVPRPAPPIPSTSVGSRWEPVVLAALAQVPRDAGTDAHTFQDAVEAALRREGAEVHREVRIANRGDGSPGLVDLVVTAPVQVAIELDRQTPREKSLAKLRAMRPQMPGVVVLRESAEPKGPTVHGASGVYVVGWVHGSRRDPAAVARATAPTAGTWRDRCAARGHEPPCDTPTACELRPVSEPTTAGK